MRHDARIERGRDHRDHVGNEECNESGTTAKSTHGGKRRRSGHTVGTTHHDDTAKVTLARRDWTQLQAWKIGRYRAWMDHREK
jgi:hypothetical protein